MASVTINNTKYTPLTFEEMLKPIAIYKLAYDETEADYEELLKNTSEWENAVKDSTIAKNLYNNYNKSLNAAMDTFSKGMTASNRKQLLELKRNYYKQIEPISKAHAAYQEELKRRIAAGEDAIWLKSNFSIDDFMGGKIPVNTYKSKKGITKETSDLISTAVLDDIENMKFETVGPNKEYIQITLFKGGKLDDLKAALQWVPNAILNNSNNPNKFIAIKQQMLDKLGYKNYDNEGKEAIMDAVNEGLYGGLGTTTTSIKDNQDYLDPLERARLQGQKQLNAINSFNLKKLLKEVDDDKDGEDGEGAYTANNIILVLDKKRNIVVKQNVDYNNPHGNPTKYEELEPYGDIKKAVDKHIGKSDVNQYSIYTWRDSKTGNNHVQIVRKGPPIKKGDAEPKPKNNLKLNPDAMPL